MIKRGTFGQQIWGTCVRLKNFFGTAINFIVFQSHLKKKLCLTQWVYPAFFHNYVDINFNIFAERNYFLVFLRIFIGFFIDSFSAFWVFYGFLRVFLWVL
jgi:hypothetical protein